MASTPVAVFNPVVGALGDFDRGLDDLHPQIGAAIGFDVALPQEQPDPPAQCYSMAIFRVGVNSWN